MLDRFLTTSMPKIIDSMRPKFYDTDTLSEEHYKRLRQLPVVDQPYDNADLVKDHRAYYVLDHNLGRVTYVMKWETRILYNKRAAYQCMVWSDPRVLALKGYAYKVFFDQLLEDNDIICTDRVQTLDGQRFWTSVVAHAFQGGMYVTYLDLNNSPPIYKQFGSQSEFDMFVAEGHVWSTLPKGKGELLVLSPTQFVVKG